MKNKSKLVAGFGINDDNYAVNLTEIINGKKKKIWVCPYYSDWCGMLYRCFSPSRNKSNACYIGCTVCEEWKYFSNFKRWVDEQPNRDWQNCNLDKDLLFKDNKCYGPDTAVYITAEINKFIPSAGKAKGVCMIGVSINRKCTNKPYISMCMNPFTKKQEYLGAFPTELLAHLAWKERKHQHACVLADTQTDSKVAQALRERYNKEGIYE